MRLYLVLSLIAVHVIASYAFVVPTTSRPKKRDEASCLAQPRLICVIKGTEGNNVEGTVTFKPVWVKGTADDDDDDDDHRGRYQCNVRVRARIKGLPFGSHGFHIHTYGDVSVSDGSSTGGHFSTPWGKERPHGLPRGKTHHWGDLGNIVSNRMKMARYSRINRMITIRGIIGRGMTIHAGKDKGVGYQPSGDAGPRVANCVIGVANPDI